MKKAFLILLFVAVCGSALAQEKTADYWVYVRLEDRSGITTADDAGRSKAGDVVAVLPVTPQHIPSETEKKEWMIYKTSLTETQKNALLETWTEVETDTTTFEIPKEYYEDTAKRAEFLESARIVNVASATEVSNTVDSKTVNVYRVSATYEYDKPIAYRKNKLDTSKLGIEVKKGLAAEKIDSTKIETSVKTVDDLAKYELKRKFYAYVQRPAIRLANVITRKAFAETVSTINKTGEDYNTLTLWEDAVDGDLVTATSQPTAEVYSDDGILETEVIIDGSTTNSSYYMKITSAEEDRHEGIYDETKTVLELDTSTAEIITVSDEYTVIEWIQFKRGTLSTTTTERKCIYYYSLANSQQQCRNNIFKFNVDSDDTGTAVISGVRIYDGSTVIYTTNNIFIGGNSSGTNMKTTALYALNGDPANNYFYNNTVIDMMYGIYEATPEVKNSIFQDCDEDIGEPGATSDYNLTDLTDVASGFSAGNNVFESTLTFNNAAGKDYHLASTDTDAINAGVDLGTTGGVNIDIDNRDRDALGDTWDIGADEYVGAATRRRMIMIY